LSGHGFKFAPVIGQQLVDLLQGASHPNCEFLRLKRIRESSDL
jgi:glycine/D-amino acid oxidase-like deaminating enzyme